MLTSTKYQRHIDGLRAVAVLSVIFYHFGQRLFSGGYVGVDVFFVISGFLITRLILDEMDETRQFDFKRFYIRRMRRLLPALLVTLVVSFIFALALLPPEQFQKFGRSLAAAIFSVSNILFWTESGYFDLDAHVKPLLHTWSLSVEEQFYLFWPVLLFLLMKNVSRYRRLSILATIAIASLALNHFWVIGNFDAEYASTIFYLTPFRVIELAIGAMALFAVPLFSFQLLRNHAYWLHEVGMVLGLTLIGYSVFGYTDTLTFPYYYALLPCVGAVLVILSAKSRFFGILLSNRLAVGIGLISYSLYLVHWPVLVFYEYYQIREPNGVEYIGLFAVIFLLAIVMYFFVEKPFRRYAPSRFNAVPQQAFVLSSASTMIIIGIIGLQIGTSSGWTWRYQEALSAKEILAGKNRRFTLIRQGCKIDRLNKLHFCNRESSFQILVIGNSHEPDGYNAFTTVYKKNKDVNLIYFGTINTCNIQFDNISGIFSQVSDRNCAKRAEILNDTAFISSLDGLVYSARNPFGKNKQELWRILSYLKKVNSKLPMVVVGEYLSTDRDCSELINHFNTADACKSQQYVKKIPFSQKELVRNKSKIQHFSGIVGSGFLYIDKWALLCPNGTLESCAVMANGEPVSYDKHHLSLGFATYVGERITETYGEALHAINFPPLIATP